MSSTSAVPVSQLHQEKRGLVDDVGNLVVDPNGFIQSGTARKTRRRIHVLHAAEMAQRYGLGPQPFDLKREAIREEQVGRLVQLGLPTALRVPEKVYRAGIPKLTEKGRSKECNLSLLVDPRLWGEDAENSDPLDLQDQIVRARKRFLKLIDIDLGPDIGYSVSAIGNRKDIHLPTDRPYWIWIQDGTQYRGPGQTRFPDDQRVLGVVEGCFIRVHYPDILRHHGLLLWGSSGWIMGRGFPSCCLQWWTLDLKRPVLGYDRPSGLADYRYGTPTAGKGGKSK